MNRNHGLIKALVAATATIIVVFICLKINLGDITSSLVAIIAGITTGFITFKTQISINRKQEIIKKQSERNSNLEFELQRMVNKIEKANSPFKDNLYYSIKTKNAFIPKANKLLNYVSDYFLIDKPKDSVGGDFYWFNYNKNILTVVVADCTGHGVPGALTSILALSFFENSINNQALLSDSPTLLESLSNRINVSLNKKNQEQNGLDLAICQINIAENWVKFTGAFADIIITQNNSLKLINGTRRPIGSNPGNIDKFELHKFSIKKGDTLYFFTDGYYDQFGGKEGKKIRKKKFVELIDEIKELPFNNQKEMLEKYLYKWMHQENQDSYVQIDDILILGVRM